MNWITPAPDSAVLAHFGHHLAESVQPARAQHRHQLQEPARHGLHDQPQTGIVRRALGLTQQMGGCAFPGAGHGAQHLGKLLLGILWKGLVHFHFIVAQRGLQSGQAGFGWREHIRIQPRDMLCVGLDKGQIKRGGGGFAEFIGNLRVAGIVHADIQDRPGAAPIGVAGRRAHGQQLRRIKPGDERAQVRTPPRRSDGAHGLEGQGDGLWHRQIQADQPLQAFRPPAMRAQRNGRRDGDFRIIHEAEVLV